jgi:hypothetical protein
VRMEPPARLSKFQTGPPFGSFQSSGEIEIRKCHCW